MISIYMFVMIFLVQSCNKYTNNFSFYCDVNESFYEEFLSVILTINISKLCGYRRL